MYLTSFGLFICRHIHDTLSISCENISLKTTHGSFPIFQFMPNCCTNPPGCAVLPNLTMKKYLFLIYWHASVSMFFVMRSV